MKVKIYGVAVEGSPKDLLVLVRLAGESYMVKESIMEAEKRPMDDEDPRLTRVRTKSDIIRAKLAEDPNYNPYPGVVPSKETLVEREERRPYGAELDTGIQYE